MSIDSILRTVLIVLGAPKDESRYFYRDVTLALLFTVACIVAIVSAAAPAGRGALIASGAVAALCLLFATKRFVLIAAALGIFAVRFAVQFVVTQNYVSLVLAVLAIALFAVVVRLDATEYDSKR